MLSKVADYFDAPEILDCSVHNIPSSASLPYQVVASIQHFITKVSCTNTSSSFIDIFVGAIGQESKIGFFGAAYSEIECIIPPGSRISLRNKDPSAITSGYVSCQFYTPVPEGTGKGQYRIS